LKRDGSLILPLWKVPKPSSIHSQISDKRQSQSNFNDHALPQSTLREADSLNDFDKLKITKSPTSSQTPISD
jgi:hypothetical protein